MLTNLNICPETELRVLLPAREIPDGSMVSKRTGEEVYVLRHKLVAYPEDAMRKAGATPIEIAGIFLIGSRGGINQVQETTVLHWRVTAEDFIDIVKSSWGDNQ